MSGDGAKVVKEPHWMIMWPFDASASKLPTAPNPSGVYVMFEEVPTRTSWCIRIRTK